MNSDFNRIAVIGQGYVGLPLAMAAVSAGLEVIGIDSDSERISKLSSGNSPIEDISSAEISKALSNGYSVSNSIVDIGGCKVVIFCLPTPLDGNSKPDLSILLNAVTEAAKHLSSGNLVIV